MTAMLFFRFMLCYIVRFNKASINSTICTGAFGLAHAGRKLQGLQPRHMVKIVKTSTVDALVNLLTERINKRVYVPGGKLPSERKLQEEFGVGRLALREALSRMNAMGIVETSHGRGTFVQDRLKSQTLKNILSPHFSLDNSKRLKEFADVRAMVESEIVGLLAQQKRDSEIDKLEAILSRKFDESVPNEVIANWDLQFHKQLAELVDNRLLRMIHEALISHIEFFLHGYVKSKKNPNEIMEAHRPILEAIKDGNEEEASKRMRLHVSYGMQDYENFMTTTRSVYYDTQI